MPRARYAPAARALHWAIFALVALAYLFINLVDVYPRGSSGRAAMMSWHCVAGLGVLLLVLPRVWVRTRHAVPPITPPVDRASALLAGVTHLALYAFLLVQPLLGVFTLQLEGRPVKLLGTVVLPSFVGTPDRALAHTLEDIHGTVGEVFYWVIGLHIAAALWHHFVRHDDTLRRMA